MGELGANDGLLNQLATKYFALVSPLETFLDHQAREANRLAHNKPESDL